MGDLTVSASQSPDESVDFAWRVHDALNEWTARVDVKASIVLALESGVLALITVLSKKHGPLGRLSDLSLLLYRFGLFALSVAAVLSALVVTPRLRRRQTRREWRDGLVFFGHLRHWDASKLSERLTSVDSERLKQLSAQLVAMSKIAWHKHALLQFSMAFLLVGSGLMFVASL